MEIKIIGSLKIFSDRAHCERLAISWTVWCSNPVGSNTFSVLHTRHTPVRSRRVVSTMGMGGTGALCRELLTPISAEIKNKHICNSTPPPPPPPSVGERHVSRRLWHFLMVRTRSEKWIFMKCHNSGTDGSNPDAVYVEANQQDNHPPKLRWSVKTTLPV